MNAGWSIQMAGDPVRLAEALHGVVKAVDGLPEAERFEVLRAACSMYAVPVLGGADGGAAPRPKPRRQRG